MFEYDFVGDVFWIVGIVVLGAFEFIFFILRYDEKSGLFKVLFYVFVFLVINDFIFFLVNGFIVN